MTTIEQILIDNRTIVAAGNGDANLVSKLFDEGADIRAACDCALRRATDSGHTETVTLLLDRGADIHARHHYALRSAVGSGHTQMVALLLCRYQTNELQSLKEAIQCDRGGTDKLLPLVNMEIARRLVQKIINEQPEVKI